MKPVPDFPLIYLLILNYQTWQDSIECLESVFALDYTHFKVIWIDNQSPNQSTKYLRAWAERQCPECASDEERDFFQKKTEKEGAPLPYHFFEEKDLPRVEWKELEHQLVMIQASENGGFAAGNNVFLKQILQEDAYLWLLNPDTTLAQDTLRQLVRCCQGAGRAKVWGCCLKDYQEREKVLLWGGCRVHFVSGTVSLITKLEELADLDYIHGGAFFTHVSNFREVGLLPEDYFLYWEETDWCYRAKRQGIELKVCQEAICYDKVGTSIGRGFLAEYYYSLNALRFAHKYKPWYIVSILGFNILRIIKRLWLGRWTHTRAILKAMGHFLAGGKTKI